MILTIIVFFYAFISVIFLTVIGLPINFICFLGLQKFRQPINFFIARGWARSLIKLVRCKLTITGMENVPKKGGLCFVSNHGSIFDVLLVLVAAGRPFGFIAKKELLYVPFINMWISMLGGYFIDRKNLRKSFKTINKGINRIKTGEAMIVFPEGSRSRGQGLLPFRAGSLKLATQAQAPIIPIAIKNSYDVFEKNYRIRPSIVNVTVCKPIYTAVLPVTDRTHILSDKVYQQIKEALEN